MKIIKGGGKGRRKVKREERKKRRERWDKLVLKTEILTERQKVGHRDVQAFYFEGCKMWVSNVINNPLPPPLDVYGQTVTDSYTLASLLCSACLLSYFFKRKFCWC